MKNCLILTIICLTICACVSPYQGQANALNQAYQRGQISASDYHARMTELRALDFQQRQAADQATQQIFQNMANSYQPNYLPPLQPMPVNPPRSTSGYGTITSPTGQMYMYNYNQY